MEPSARDLVTGGAGFIGSHLVDRLVSMGRLVRVVDTFCTGRRDNLAAHAGAAEVEVIEADVRDREAMTGAMGGVDRVFHLAALADIVPSIEHPEAYFETNAEGTFSVLLAARAAGVRRFVYTASSSCYGIPQVYPTPETAPIHPRYPYALAKYLGECLVLHWAEVYRLPAVSVRLFNVYGPRSRTTGAYGAVFGVFLAQLRAREPLTVVGDGTQTRDFTFVSDAVEAIVRVAGSERPGDLYNVGTGREVSVNRLVELLGGGDVVHIPKRPGEPDRTLADASRITRELGWRPTVPIEEGVRILLQHLEDWKDAPVWTAETIACETASWFKYLGVERPPDEAG